MRIMLPIVMAVLLCVLLISCGTKDVSAPTIEPFTETTVDATENNMENITPTDKESEYLCLGGMKSDVVPECKVLVRSFEDSKIFFVEDKDSRSGYSIQISEKKKLTCNIDSLIDIDTQSTHTETIATGKDMQTQKMTYKVVRRTKPASEDEDVYFIYINYGCKYCELKFLVALSTNNTAVENDSTVKQYAVDIVNNIECYCPTCCK